MYKYPWASLLSRGIWKKGAIVLDSMMEVQNNQFRKTLGGGSARRSMETWSPKAFPSSYTSRDMDEFMLPTMSSGTTLLFDPSLVFETTNFSFL